MPLITATAILSRDLTRFADGRHEHACRCAALCYIVSPPSDLSAVAVPKSQAEVSAKSCLGQPQCAVRALRHCRDDLQLRVRACIWASRVDDACRAGKVDTSYAQRVSSPSILLASD